MAFASMSAAKPGRGGRGYQPRVKNSKPQKTTESKPRFGTASPGKAGLGKLGNQKPGFKQPPKPQKPAAAPKPQKPAVGQHPEFDQAYYDQIDDIDEKGTQQLSQLDETEGAVKRDYGIEDTTDPFSRVNGLKRMFLARQKAASAGLASQGQLYSGAHERALNRTRYEEEAARAELRKNYEEAINKIGADKAGVKFSTEEERNQAFEDFLARAPEADVALTDEEVNADQAPAGSQPGYGGGQLAPGTQVPLLNRTGGVPASSAAAQQILSPLGNGPRPSSGGRGIDSAFGGGNKKQSQAEKARAARQQAQKAAKLAEARAKRDAKKAASAPAKGPEKGSSKAPIKVQPKPKPRVQPKPKGRR